MHIILGGTTGLGWELTEQIRQKGGRVLVLGKTHHSEKHGEGFGVDLSDSDSVQRAIYEIEEYLNGDNVESFYWCAGYGYRSRFGEQPFPDVMGSVNFSGALPMVQWAWNKMISQDEMSNFVIVSSSCGVKTRPGEAVYIATKHAQVGLARSLGQEAEEFKDRLKVALFLPGGMKTQYWEGREPDGYENYNDPKKVATKMLETVAEQKECYSELAMERGSLV